MSWPYSDTELAFLLGIMVTREGYNGECDYEHLAPSRLKPHGFSRPIKQAVDELWDNQETRRLCCDAMEYIKTGQKRGRLANTR